jgi:hypothetical protein
LLAYLLGLAASIAGCGAINQPGATPPFMPSWPEARHALESVLTAWLDARPPLPPSFDTSEVIFVDKQRQPNQRLLAFQILAQSEIENARQFTVRLRLEGQDKPQLVKYNILGRHPVWVFRLEDLEMFTHWEMDMREPKPGPDDPTKKSAEPAKAGATD